MRTLVLIGVLLCALSGMAQEQLKHQKRLYQTPEGKLYLNKALPIYLWMSTSDKPGAEKIQLKSEDSKAYTNPMYLDTEGFNSVRTPSKVDTVTREKIYPVEDIIFEIYADSEAPRCKISIDSAKMYRTKTMTFTSGQVYININTSDALSGVQETYFSKNGVPFTPFKNAVVINEEQEHSVKSYSVDNVGNASKTTERVFTIDKTAPTTTLNAKGDSIKDMLSGRTNIILNAKDATSGVRAIYYSIDGGAKKKYTYQISTKYFKEGEHTISYYAVDNVGNEESPKTYTVFVDKTPPMVIDELQGNTYFINGKEFSSGRTKMKLTAIDNKAGVKEIYYTFDGKNYQLYDKPFYLPNNKGNLSIAYYAVDNVNNKSSANQEGQKSRLTYMDLTGPRLNFNFQGLIFRNRDTVFINKKTKIALRATDGESGIKKITYNLNGGQETEYNGPFTCEKEARYKISYTGYDNVNNSNAGEFHFIVDTTGPDIFERYSIESIGKQDSVMLYPSHVVLFLSATDIDAGYSKLYYSINGAPQKLYTGVVSGFTKNKRYEVKIKAYDKLNNFKEKTIYFGTGD